MPHVPNIRIRERATKDGKGRIYLDFYVQGRRHREFIGPINSAIKKRAKQVAAQRAAEIANGRYVDPGSVEHVRFGDFVAEYMDVHGAKHRAADRTRGILGLFSDEFRNRLLTAIARQDVERYQTRRGAQVKPATVNRELAVLKALFNKAISWGRADANPVVGVRRLKENNQRDTYLEDEEAARLLAVCSPHLRAAMTFARNTGLRQGELVALTWADVDLKTGYVRVRNAKSGEGREVPLCETAKTVLRGLPRGLRTDRLFLKPNGEPVTGDWLYQSFKRACQKASIEGFCWHSLRHDAASWLVMGGAGLESVQAILGHKTPSMTARYAHLSQDHKLRAVRVLDRKLDTSMDTTSAEESVK